jgi:hypothetical protein
VLVCVYVCVCVCVCVCVEGIAGLVLLDGCWGELGRWWWDLGGLILHVRIGHAPPS